MKVALVNPHWTFDGSIYFGCREPHLPLELGYAKALLERAGHEVADARRASVRPRARPSIARAGRGLRARHDRRDDRAELSVLALRAAGAAGAAASSCDAARRHRGGATVAVGPHGSTTPARPCASSASTSWCMGECEEIVRRLAEPAPGTACRPRLCDGQRDDPRSTAARRPAASSTCRPCAGRTSGSRRHHHHHHRFDAPPARPGRRGRGLARLPLSAAPSAPRTNFRDRYRAPLTEPSWRRSTG